VQWSSGNTQGQRSSGNDQRVPGVPSGRGTVGPTAGGRSADAGDGWWLVTLQEDET
jgi:hypothetical protein